MSLDALLRQSMQQNIGQDLSQGLGQDLSQGGNVGVQPQKAPVGIEPQHGMPTIPSPASSTPSAPDLGAGLTATLFSTPDILAHAPNAVDAKPVDTAAENAILHQAGRQIAGGVQGLRDLGQTAAPSTKEALAQVNACYANAVDTASLGDIDKEVPQVFSQALLRNELAQGALGDDGSQALAEACKDKLTQLFTSTDKTSVEDAQQFFMGLRTQLEADNAIDNHGAALMRGIEQLATSKLDTLSTGAMADLEDVVDNNFELQDAQDKVNTAVGNLADAKDALASSMAYEDEFLAVNISTLFSENQEQAIAAAKDNVAFAQQSVSHAEKNLADAEFTLVQAQTECFAELAGRVEIRVTNEANEIMGSRLDAMSQGTCDKTILEMSQNINNSPLLTDQLRGDLQGKLEDFSDKNAKQIEASLGEKVMDLHVPRDGDGKVELYSGNLEARATQLRHDIMSTTLEGFGQEEALGALDKVMTSLRAERAEGLQEFLSGAGSLNLNEAQAHTITTLFNNESVSYDTMAVGQLKLFGTGLGEQIDTITQGMQENATVDQKLAAAHSIDMMLMDNPLLGDVALAMKESIIQDGDEGYALMLTQHDASCAKSEAFAAVGETKEFAGVLNMVDKDAGCDKHHVASLNMNELMGYGLGSGSKTQAASVVLLHAAWSEQKSILAGENLTDDQLDVRFADFVEQLPPKMQHVLGKGNTDMSSLEHACSTGITNKAQYKAALASVKEAAVNFDGHRARNSLYALSGTLTRGQVNMAEEHLIDGIIARIDPSTEGTGFGSALRMDEKGTMETIKNLVTGSPFATKIGPVGAQTTVGSDYVDALDFIEESNYAVSHGELLQEVMAAQGVSKAGKVEGETLAVTCQYIDRVLTESVHDLSNAELARVGLSRSDVNDIRALELAIEHTDWGNTDSDFAIGAVLHELYTHDCAVNGTKIPNSGDFVAFAEQKGVPKSLCDGLKQTYDVLTASVEDRQVALKGLSLHPSNTHAVRNKHVDFEKMKVSTSAVRHSTDEHAKDSPEKAHSREFTRTLAAYTDHSGDASSLHDMKDTLKHIIETYRPKMDVILMVHESRSTSVADRMQKLDKKVFDEKALAKPNGGPDLHRAVRTAVRSESMGLINAGKNLHTLNDHLEKSIAITTGMHSSLDTERGGVRGAILKKISFMTDRIRAHNATHVSQDRAIGISLMQTSLLRAFQASGAKTFDTFGQQYRAELEAAHGAIGKTSVHATMVKELCSFGVQEDVANARARGMLKGFKGAMPRLLKTTIRQAGAKNLEKQLTLAAGDTSTKTEVRRGLCADATQSLLADMGTGDAISISSAGKITIKAGLPSPKETENLGLSAMYSHELKESIMMTRDHGGRPEVSISSQALASFAVSASALGTLLKGTISGTGSSGLRLSFADDGDCANFMANIFTGGGSVDSLAYVDEVHFTSAHGIGAGVLAQENVVGTVNTLWAKAQIAEAAAEGIAPEDVDARSIPAARLEANASAQASRTVSHETHRHGETTRVTTNHQFSASAAVGLGGSKEVAIRGARSLASTMGVGANVKNVGRDAQMKVGVRAQRTYAVENTLETNFGLSRGKILNGENIRVIQSARRTSTASFRAADGNVQDLAKDFMAKHNVPASAQKEVEAWIATHKQGLFTVVVAQNAKASAIENKSEKDAQKALKDENSFTFGGVTIKTNKTEYESKGYIPLGNFTLKFTVDGNRSKAVTFTGNGRDAG